MAMLHIPGQAGRSFAAILFATAGLIALAPAQLGAQPADPVANAEARPSSPASDALTQRNVPAEATAENGVIAQERAFVAAGAPLGSAFRALSIPPAGRAMPSWIAWCVPL